MAIYLKKFENHTQYENYINGSDAILPNVSICITEGDVHYNPSTPPTPSHDFVEIGGIKWATMNVGANSVTDTGLYFQWGDTQGYTAAQVGTDKNFTWIDYKYGNGTIPPVMTKYNDEDGLTTLQSSDDAAVANWGGNWRMPTTDEFQTLLNNTTSAWTADYEGSGVKGLILTSNSDSNKRLFFPAAANAFNGNIYNVGIISSYWSSSLGNGPDGVADSYCFYGNSSSIKIEDSYGRASGCPVRGVLDE